MTSVTLLETVSDLSRFRRKEMKDPANSNLAVDSTGEMKLRLLDQQTLQNDSSNNDPRKLPESSMTVKWNEKETQRKPQHNDKSIDANNRFLRALSGQPNNASVSEGCNDDSVSDNDCVSPSTGLLAMEVPTSGNSMERIIVKRTPSYAGWFPHRRSLLPATQRYSKQLKQQEGAGLYVDEELKQLRRLESSTIDRLEERLEREFLTAESNRGNKQGSPGLLIRNLLSPRDKSPILRRSVAINDANTTSIFQQTDNAIGSDLRPNCAPCLAKLKLFVDRVVLDDHPTFTLADRLTAQLRALYRAYTRKQQLQPWQLPLQRLNDFFFQSANNLAKTLSSNLSANVSLSSDQVIQILQQLDTEIEGLNQLHLQILAKSDQLRVAGKRSEMKMMFRIKQVQRKQPIDLSRVGAILDLLETSHENQQHEASSNDADKQQQALKKLSESFDLIFSTSSHALQTVLQLKEINKQDSASEVSYWSPRIYVKVRLNGKSACTTKVQACTRGEVRFCETLCFTVPFFPSSICAEVYEYRRLLSNKLLSTSAFPVVIPGQNVVKSAQFRSRSPEIDRWKDKDVRKVVTAACLAPSDEWYEFSNTTPIFRKQWHYSFHNEPLFANTSRRTHGRLHVQTSWISELSCSISAAILPPKRLDIADKYESLSTKVQLIEKPTKRRSTQLPQFPFNSTFSNEQDFFGLIQSQKFAFDPNNPDDLSLRPLKTCYTHQQQKEMQAINVHCQKIFRTSSEAISLTESNRGLTNRNRLIRLRDREYASGHNTKLLPHNGSEKFDLQRSEPQHAVFDEALPMLEHELLTDERLLRLLRPELRAFDRRLLFEKVERADMSIVERHRARQLLKLHNFRGNVRQMKTLRVFDSDLSTQEALVGRSRPLATIVQENPLPLFPGTFEWPAIETFFAPRRRLRPHPKIPVSQTVAGNWPTACTLYIQVQKAVNLPVRIKRANSTEGVATTEKRGRVLQRTKRSPRMRIKPPFSDYGSENTPCGGIALEFESHIFVQISFQGKVRQTTCATITGTVDKQDDVVGAHATWMETVTFPFYPPQDDWSPNGIERTRDVIRLSLYDQVSTSAPKRINKERHDGEKGFGTQTRALHRENCFLGTLEIPFLTLYRAGRLEGSLRCQMPVEHLGYANLQLGAAYEAISSRTKTSSIPTSIASSNSEDGSPRQGRTSNIPLRSPRISTSVRETPHSKACSIKNDNYDGTDELRVEQTAREATFLKLTLLLDPILPANTRALNSNDSNATRMKNAQDEVLLAHAQRWVTSVRSAAPASTSSARNCNVFVCNLAHGVTFLPQFLQAQSPPKELQTASLLALVRYVSLIPFLDDCIAFDGYEDVWLTSQEFLDMGAGGHKEHAVLLANYFMWHDHHYRQENDDYSKIYLVVGDAVPEGNIVYVLRKRVLWNASTGVGYAISDPHCPLRDVTLVVSSSNVFANIQPIAGAFKDAIGSSHELNWNIESNAKCWKPFFLAESITFSPSVQHRKLIYSETSPEFVNEVEREMREALKLAIRRWRSSHFTTYFNEAAGLQLREHLMKLEHEASDKKRNRGTLVVPSAQASKRVPSPRSTTELDQKLKVTQASPTWEIPSATVLHELQRSHEVCGLPLHVSLADIPQVLKIVENTVNVVVYLISCSTFNFTSGNKLIFSCCLQNIHYNERPGVEFALAVYVCGYPNYILSMWVYFAALVPF